MMPPALRGGACLHDLASKHLRSGGVASRVSVAQSRFKLSEVSHYR